MLEYKLLDKKPHINTDDDTYIDLLTKTYDDTQKFACVPLMVNKHYVARPDLIALAALGDDKYADILCKLNGISNPFELNEEMIILIPNFDYVNDCVINSSISSELVNDPETDTIQKIDKNNMQKKKSDDRSPNEQVVGDSNYIIDKSLGIVFY